MSRLEFELQWFIHRSESDVGFKSNWSAVINNVGGPRNKQVTDPNSDARLYAARRAGRMKAALESISPLYRSIVMAVNGNLKVDQEALDLFGHTIGAEYVYLLSKDKKAANQFHDVCKKVIAKQKLTAQEAELLLSGRNHGYVIYKKSLLSLARALQLLDKTS